MFDFGIAGYQPHWLRGREATAAAHGTRLAALAGRTLAHVWLVWDLDADDWFADCPVLLDFGTAQVEINHERFDDLSITWNSIDPTQPVTWPTSDDFHLAWRPEPLPQLTALPGQRLDHAEFLEWVDDADMADGSVGVGFVFPTANLVISNGLDVNNLSYTPPAPHYRRHPLLP